MDNFIAYLDKNKEAEYFDAVNFICTTNTHYFRNNLGDIAYTGLKGYELWQDSHLADISLPIEIKKNKTRRIFKRWLCCR